MSTNAAEKASTFGPLNSAMSRATALRRQRPKATFLYVWLLVAVFVEYARPTNQLTFLDFPYFYSLVPMSLLVVQMFATGLRPMKEIFADSAAKWCIAIMGAVTLSWAATGFGFNGSPVFQGMLGYLFLFLLIARIVTTEARLRGLVLALVTAHLYLLAMNFNVLTNPSERQYLTGGTFLGDGNDYSLSMCILIPLMIEIALSAKSRLTQVLSWVAVAVIILAIVATQSRGGTLGIAAVLAYLWWRSPRKIVSGVAIALVGGIVLLYAPSQYFSRMSTVTGMQIDGSAQGRIDAWSGAIGMGAQNPVFGIGVGEFSARWGRTAHSTYMLAFAELGIPGFVCVVGLVFGNIRSNMRLRKTLLSSGGSNEDPDRRRTLRLLDMQNGATVGFAVTGAFLSATYYPHMYVLSALAIATRVFANRAAEAAPRAEPLDAEPTQRRGPNFYGNVGGRVSPAGELKS